jgi:hypothetical protein
MASFLFQKKNDDESSVFSRFWSIERYKEFRSKRGEFVDEDLVIQLAKILE